MSSRSVHAVTRYLIALLLLQFLSFTEPAAESVTPLEDFNSYFEELQQEFERIAGSSVVRKPKLSPVDGYFVQVLKRHQPIYSLVRTNSKGVIINEVVRGEKPTRDYRGVSSQQWFQEVSRTLETYYGFVKEDNGRYYLFWTRPITITTKAGGSRFNGAVAAKIDLWDIFHKLSAKHEQPFLVRLANKSLYSHKWEKVPGATEESFVVPGVDRISVRYVKDAAPVDSSRNDISGKEAALRSDTVAMAGPVFGVAPEKKAGKKGPFPFSFKVGKRRFLVFGLLLILIPAGLLIRFVVWFKHWSLMRRIDKESEF